MSNYGDFIVDYDSSRKQNFKHIHGKIECEITERKNAMDCIEESIADLKKQLHEEVHFRRLLVKLFTSIDCDNTENQILISHQLQIHELEEHVHKLSQCLEKANEYINDLYWALFKDKPAVIGAIIEPPFPPDSLCPPSPPCPPSPHCPPSPPCHPHHHHHHHHHN